MYLSVTNRKHFTSAIQNLFSRSGLVIANASTLRVPWVIILMSFVIYLQSYFVSIFYSVHVFIADFEMGICGRIICSLQEVNLSAVLRSGQSFR